MGILCQECAGRLAEVCVWGPRFTQEGEAIGSARFLCFGCLVVRLDRADLLPAEPDE